MKRLMIVAPEEKNMQRCIGRIWLSGIVGAVVSVGLMMPNVAQAICLFGSGSGEPSLQTVLNQQLTVAPSATNDCLTEERDASWVAQGGAAATLLVELAGYSNQNTFGIYDINDASRRLQIFGGSNHPNDTRTITVTDTGGGFRFDIARPASGTIIGSDIFATASFGYYITTPELSGQIYFSASGLNADAADHMYAYQGNNSYFRDDSNVPPSVRGTQFDPTMFLLAWEDLLNGGDGDYQDMVVLTRSITPVPIPAALALFGSGFMLFGFLRRRASLPNDAGVAV